MIIGMIMLILLIVLSKFIIEKGMEEEENSQIAVIIPAECKYELKDLILGINDNARAKNTKINMIYGSEWSKEKFEETIKEERKLGSKAVLIVYPERFVNDYENKELSTYLPAVVLNDHNYTNNIANTITASYSGIENITSKHIEKADIYNLIAGKIDEVVVPAEYHMGYICIDSLTKNIKNSFMDFMLPAGYFSYYNADRNIGILLTENTMEDIFVPVLRITRKSINEGKYNGILEDR